MPNEITFSASLSVSKDGSTVTGNLTDVEDLAGVGKYAAVQNIGTTAELISFPGDLTTEGISFLWFRNMDPTNYIDLARDSGMAQTYARLKPGQVALIPPAAGNPTIYARANTAACNLQIVAAGT
jgi:hypothetical protein